MTQYKYINLRIMDKNYNGAGNIEHRKIIDEQAKQGYKFVGWIPTDIGIRGIIHEVDLIFEINN